MATVSSVLPLSTTSFSAAKGTLSKQRAIFCASLRVITTSVKGRRSAMPAF
jgi:hypothetical protein